MYCFPVGLVKGLTYSLLISLWFVFLPAFVCAEGSEWNTHEWSVDYGAAEVRIISPFEIKDLPDLGVFFKVDEQAGKLEFEFNSNGVIEFDDVLYDDVEQKIDIGSVMGHGKEIIAAQEKYSAEMLPVVTRMTRSEGVVEFSEGTYIPFSFIEDAKNKFNKNPLELITLHKTADGEDIEILVAELDISYGHVHSESMVRFYIFDGGQLIDSLAFKNIDYRLYKNRRGELYLVVKSYGFEGFGVNSYLVNGTGMKNVASIDVGV